MKTTRSQSPRNLRQKITRNYLGTCLAAMLFCLSQLPSLLPRPWLMQGVISGISLAVGYGLGVSLSKLVRWLTELEPSNSLRHRAWQASYGFPIIMVGSVMVGHGWQNEVRQLLGQTPISSLHVVRILAVSLLVGYGLLAVSRGLRLLARRISTLLGRWVPRRVGIALGVTCTAVIVMWVVNGFMLGTFINTANSIYKTANDKTTPGITQPTSELRSGGTNSTVSWQSLGTRGRDFVARGPSQQQIQAFSGKPAQEPIRIYVGVETLPTARQRAERAVQELTRTGAFSRDVLVVATATGSGWLEPQAVDSIEYMHNGNTAIVTQQYSYLPSWISFLVDSQNARDAGRELYDAVYTEWAKLPVDNRPKLIAYGLSLGSFGGQSTFSSAQDMRRSVDGALFLGTPSNTTLWHTITANRDAGSTQIKPVYDRGTTVRFAATQADIQTDQTSWQTPRVLYMQHASDPVIWWSYDLLIHKPDWLREPRGHDVSPRTRWIPVITFLHATVDQFYGVTVPNGHGHNYADTIVSAWASVAPPTDWSDQQTSRLQAIIDTYQNE